MVDTLGRVKKRLRISMTGCALVKVKGVTVNLLLEYEIGLEPRLTPPIFTSLMPRERSKVEGTSISMVSPDMTVEGKMKLMFRLISKGESYQMVADTSRSRLLVNPFALNEHLSISLLLESRVTTEMLPASMTAVGLWMECTSTSILAL